VGKPVVHLIAAGKMAACGSRPGTSVGSGCNTALQYVTCAACLRIGRELGLEPAGVLLADPAWRFGDSLPGKGRGASKHYATLSIDEIKAFPLPPLADDAVLVLWRVAAMAAEAYEVVRAWGFTAKSEIVWVKVADYGSKRLRIGMGRSVRNCHESAIIATRGKPQRLSMSEPSVVFAPRLEHSRKPLAVHRLLERLYPGPYHELFARRVVRGWRCEGNEIETEAR
jgi:N6-adenosine-specific RNA methylase IME4